MLSGNGVPSAIYRTNGELFHNNGKCQEKCFPNDNGHCVTICPVAPNPMLMAVLEITELLLLLPSKW